MLRSRPFAHDPETGAVTKWWHYDDADDTAIIEDVIDLDAVGAHNSELRKYNTGRFGDGMHWIGSVPMPIYWRLKKRGIFDDPAAFRRWWLSDDSLPFRGRDMKV